MVFPREGAGGCPGGQALLLVAQALGLSLWASHRHSITVCLRLLALLRRFTLGSSAKQRFLVLEA